MSKLYICAAFVAGQFLAYGLVLHLSNGNATECVAVAEVQDKPDIKQILLALNGPLSRASTDELADLIGGLQ